MAQGRAGRRRALAVTTTKRWGELPDVPTLAEAGVPGYEATLWLNLATPAGMPQEIVQRPYAETAKALQDPELQRSFRSLCRSRGTGACPAGTGRIHAGRI